MGIRFYCPNGHKLNVKNFLGGMKGICPVCGAKLRIPEDSTRRSTKEELADPQGNEGEAAGQQEAVAPSPATQSDSKSAPPASSNPLPLAAADDPANEGSNVVWYVRPPSGGQFGPASGDIMQTWLAEGRVDAESLVWRDGWPDWLKAGDVFSQLKPQKPVSQQSVPQLRITGLDELLSGEMSEPREIHPVVRRHRSPAAQIFAIASVAAAAIVLVVVVIWMLLR